MPRSLMRRGIFYAWSFYMQQPHLFPTLEIREPHGPFIQPIVYNRSKLVSRALKLLESEMRQSDVLSSPTVVRDYVRLLLGDRPHEVFAVVFLDAHHRVIKSLELFRGTLTQTSVYPREVMVEALALGSSAVLLVHNHPSGCEEPSRADEVLTQTLKSALSMVDVRVLDHFIVTRQSVTSFAERGLI